MPTTFQESHPPCFVKSGLVLANHAERLETVPIPRPSPCSVAQFPHNRASSGIALLSFDAKSLEVVYSSTSSEIIVCSMSRYVPGTANHHVRY